MNDDSVTVWLRQLGQGDQEAARQLWDRYSSALLRLTRSRFGGAVTAVADEEDLVQSVFQALWHGATTGRFETVKDRDELWWLLLTITRRKAVNRQAYNARGQRTGQAVPWSDLETTVNGFAATNAIPMADEQPPPELILMLEEEQQRLLAMLRDDRLRSIAVWKLEGLTHEEIAGKLRVTPRTIVRKLNLIRETWSQELER